MVLMAQLQLSKSDYMLYLKHPAWLWLKKHDKNKLPEVSADLQAMFDAGHEFEQYAEAHFPDGVQLGFNNYNEYLDLPARTKQTLDDGAKTIFQGRFEHEQLTFICDVLRIVGENEVNLYEIKSSTSAKQDHILDLAFQVTVLERCGYSVANIYVMHVDNNYVKNGPIDHKRLVATANVTEAVKHELHRTERNIAAAIEVAKSSKMPDPSPSGARLGSYKEWLEVYKNITPVPEGSIYELCRLNAGTVKLIETEGITKLAEIPEGLVDKKQQHWQLQAVKQGSPIIDTEKIAKFIDSLKFPLYFFDYETLSSCVPYFDGTRPYQQLPFQYSLHVLDSPGSELRHYSYLHTDNKPPFEPLSRALQEQIGSSGSVVAWNMGFEKSCNTAIAKIVPEYEQFYENLNSRMVDLMLPFSSGHYIDAGFMGSASLKNVLPVLVPELSYKELGIQEGGAAQRAWMDAVLYEKRTDEREQILADLLQYCELDTLAMVKIYQYLVEICDDGKSKHTAKPEQLGIFDE